jgi:bis(5'-nucleosyl)-tetraphosphatase (symmetrical)
VAVYVIGDVQGCYEALRRLLDHIDFDVARDQAWFVGDLVNRGPQSRAVLRFVRGLGASAVVVLGNHDLHLVSLAEGFGRPRADDTLDDVLQAPDRDELIAWLRGCAMLYVAAPHVVVHAGLLPSWDIATAQSLAREVEWALRGADYRAFLARMYGSQPARWSDDLAGFDRLRIVVNAMTRMRFCTRDGTMEFHHKGAPEDAPAGYLPWYAVPERRSAACTVLFGHWSALGLYRGENVIGLDTGCVWGGALTALRLQDAALFQVSGAKGP